MSRGMLDEADVERISHSICTVKVSLVCDAPEDNQTIHLKVKSPFWKNPRKQSFAHAQDKARVCY